MVLNTFILLVLTPLRLVAKVPALLHSTRLNLLPWIQG